MSLILNKISWSIKNKWIIKNLSIEVKNGECLALLGPSGCGKSSTLRLIAGLNSPSDGTINLDQKDITNIEPANRRVGMVFQSYALFPHLNVAQNLSIGLKVRGTSTKKQKELVSYALALMQLEDFSLSLPSELSGGQRQRVALARALLRDPKVYLLDEPMSNLDAQLREELRPQVRKLIRHGNQPVVYVTHDQHEAMAMANKIAVLNNGELQQIGTPKDLYNQPQSIFVANFIGRPQINILKENQNITKGIRPEDIYLSDKGLICKLNFIEWLGNNQLWYLETEKGIIRYVCDASTRVPSEIIINWDKEKEHHFDSNTGIRIRKRL